LTREDANGQDKKCRDGYKYLRYCRSSPNINISSENFLMTSIEFNSQLINLESSLMKFAYRLMPRKPDVQDLVQETYLKVLMNQSKYIHSYNLKAWAFTIMKNTYVDNYRRKCRKNIFIDQNREALLVDRIIAAGSDEPDTAYSALEIDRNIENLHDRLRMPFNMYLTGYKYKEIADELNLNIGTVKNRIFLSRKHLMVKLNR
jgi:RNA polymerase sigma-70 factor (ECF subfamily)